MAEHKVSPVEEMAKKGTSGIERRRAIRRELGEWGLVFAKGAAVAWCAFWGLAALLWYLVR